MGPRGRPQLFAWVAAAVVGYTYLGYPALISVAAAGRRRTTDQPRRADMPTMTVLVAAHDEEQVIAQRVADVRQQDYPADRLEVLVVADGSTDSTAELARAAGARVLWEPDRRGKSVAVNRGIAASGSELVCLTDANCRFAPGALRALATCFTDSRVAVVSGAKTVSGTSAHGQGEGLYWRLEARLKAAESVFGCTSGAPGEICGLRRATVRPIPETVINDDFHLACDALARGLQVRYAPEAVALEPVSPALGDEYERRTRIGAGTWQTSLSYLTLADPRRGWVAVSFISHRLLRSILVPLLLPALLAASCAATARGPRGRGWVLLTGQIALYGGAAAGALGLPRMAAPMQFVLTNLATLRGGIRHLSGRQPVAWHRAPRLSFPGKTAR